MLTRISEFRRHRAIYCHMSRSQYSSGQYPLTWSIHSFSSSGHSHQLFHLFIIFTNLNQLSGINADLKHIRPSLNGNCESFLESVCFLSGKKSKSVFDFLTYSRGTGFSFSYGKVGELIRLIGPSNEIDRVSKFDNSLSFGAKQNALRQIFFAL